MHQKTCLPYILANTMCLQFVALSILGRKMLSQDFEYILLGVILATFHIFKNNSYFLYVTNISCVLPFFSTGLLTFFLDL